MKTCIFSDTNIESYNNKKIKVEQSMTQRKLMAVVFFHISTLMMLSAGATLSFLNYVAGIEVHLYRVVSLISIAIYSVYRIVSALKTHTK